MSFTASSAISCEANRDFDELLFVERGLNAEVEGVVCPRAAGRGVMADPALKTVGADGVGLGVVGPKLKFYGFNGLFSDGAGELKEALQHGVGHVGVSCISTVTSSAQTREPIIGMPMA